MKRDEEIKDRMKLKRFIEMKEEIERKQELERLPRPRHWHWLSQLTNPPLTTATPKRLLSHPT